ncbi:IclR family transcriptional regulator [Methylobacterium nonmethylotrophicum]|uniref:Transcriptional regulator n=1 Tax=Methylobacterium nonmethylotrophicum TaxID=1141884 RepID=A0A4Z0NLS7_9HYPH|nr:helix-turn-helix domain-containing protein [Methylobacterium nonmethylotrophicum]TGD96805.1 transcriptional regulator [Methylobacterium nonmethylotrophicum]
MADGRLQTLDRGLAALWILARHPRGLKIAELADALGVHRAIAYRIVATLADHGMTFRLPDNRIILGSGAIALAVHAEGNVRVLGRPIVERLAAQTGATAFLSMAQGSDCVALLSAEPPGQRLSIHYRVGSRSPLDKGAPGLALLAGRPERSDDPEAVKVARRQGYCVTRNELQDGAVGAASPIRMPRAGYPGLELSIGVVALSALDLDRAEAAIRSAAAALSDQLARGAGEAGEAARGPTASGIDPRQG